MSESPEAPPQQSERQSKKQAKADSAAAKARAKAERPIWKKPLFWVAAIVVIGIIMAISGGGDGETQPTAEDGENADVADEPAGDAEQEEALFPNRVDRQPNDVERRVGETVEVGGYAVTVANAEFQQSVSDFEDAGYLIADVEIVNNSDRAQPYNVFDFRVQTPGGEVQDAGFVTVPDQLESGDLVQGGETSGKVVFEIGDEKGMFFILYKPNAFDDARGVWGVRVRE